MSLIGTKRTFAALQHFVRYWIRADNGAFWPAMVCPLLTQLRHWPRYWVTSVGWFDVM
jgi:hypothetical protein